MLPSGGFELAKCLAGKKIEVRLVSSAPASLLSRVSHKVLKTLTARWIAQQNPDLVVISQGAISNGLSWMQRCRRMNLPYAIVVQSNAESWWPDDILASELLKVCRSARAIFCVSDHNLKLLERQLGEKLPNAVRVSNPCIIGQPQLVPWPNETGAWRLATVGRLHPPAKAQDILFEVLAEDKWQGRPVELNLYGEGPCENSLRNLAGFFNLKNVRFYGQVSDVVSIWRNNHLLVLPSRHEGTPLALIEAMACGRPAVVTDVGGNAELCEDGITGFVASAATKRLLAEALERAWLYRAEWQSMGEAALARLRTTMPSDPIETFCEQLQACATR